MNKTWLIVGLIVAVVLGLLIFGNIFADGRARLRKRNILEPEESHKRISLYPDVNKETVDLEKSIMV